MHIHTLRTADLAPAHSVATAEGLFLLIFRRMAVSGLDDARCLTMLMGQFGRNYRRPLILMRALMLELATSSARKILVAPPCCQKMTADEAIAISACRRGEEDARLCHGDAGKLLGRTDAPGAMTSFQAVRACFADLGMPFAACAN